MPTCICCLFEQWWWWWWWWWNSPTSRTIELDILRPQWL